MQCLSVGTARSGERCCRPVPCQLLEVPGLDTTRNPAVERLRSHVRKNDGQAQQVSCSETTGGTGVKLGTEIYGAANSAVNVIVSPARPSWEPTGATLSSLASGGPPPVTVRV